MRGRIPAWLLGICVAAAVPAFASQGWAKGASLEAATDAQKQAAQKAFLAGAKAAEGNKHEEALQHFTESYDAVASPNSHLMMARMLVKLERWTEAYDAFDETANEADAAASVDPKYEETSQAARQERDALREKIALLSISGAPPGSTVKVRGRTIEDPEKPVAVMPGMVQVELVTADGKTQTQEVNAEAGGSPTATFEAAAAPEASKPDTGTTSVSTDSSQWDQRTWAYVAGGVGAAGLLTFTVFGLMNNSKHGKLEDECQNGVCPESLESDADSGRTYQTIANVGLVVGVVGLGAGTVLYLTSDDKKESVKKRPPKPVTRVGVGPGSVVVSGTF